MVQRGAGYTGNVWNKLTPDSKAVTPTAPGRPGTDDLARQFYASAVLTSGKVLVLGGEYSGLNQPNSPTDTNSADIYNPVSTPGRRLPAPRRYPWRQAMARCGRWQGSGREFHEPDVTSTTRS